MDTRSGRTAVVIGAGSGIGRACGLAFAREGMQVVFADIDLESAEAARDAALSSDGVAIAAHVDATQRPALEALCNAARNAFGDLHLLQNAVGVVAPTHLDGATEIDWAWVIEFNLMSAVRAVDVFLPVLRAHGDDAHIINTASMAALVVRQSVPIGLYTSSKHALLGYSETLRNELASEGIGVSVLCPGLVTSNIAATSARHRPQRYGGPLEAPMSAASGSPRAISADEVARLVVRGVQANRGLIFTHADSLAPLSARYAATMEDFAFLMDGLDHP